MILLIFFILSIVFSALTFAVKNKPFVRLMTIMFAIMHIAFVTYCWFNIDKIELQYFTFDRLAVLMLTILSLLTITTVFHGFIYVKNDEPRKYSMYHSALIALISTMSGAYMANDMTAVWIFVEATTLAVAVLIYHDRTSMALEATWKYIFVCSIGIALAYVGILFLGFTVSGSEMLQLSFSSLAKAGINANPLYLKVSFVFVLVGYSTKMGLFPVHTVTIDAHSVAPPPISAFISTTLMNVGFVAIFRTYCLFAKSSILPFMQHVLLLTGILSLLIASGYMLKAKHNKRMLAYSSLENMGIVAICLGIGGIGYYAAILHIVLHSLTKAGLFYQMGQTNKVMGSYLLDHTGNYMKLYPAGATALLLGLFCITAIPPSGLFISEFMMFKQMVIGQNYFVLIVTSLLLCFVLYALTVRVLHILYSEPRHQVALPTKKPNPLQTILQYVLFGMVIYICFAQPEFLSNTIDEIVKNIPNTK